MKLEKDRVEIVGGIMAGKTIGAPISIMIKNRDHENWRGKLIAPFITPRPGHADLTAATKYGYQDLRPALERASARETAARVAIGAICKHFLLHFGIKVGGYVASIGEVTADLSKIPIEKRAALAEESDVRCPDSKAAKQMQTRIRAVMDERDTLGGIIEVVVTGLPAGLGSHVHADRRLSGQLASAALSVQAMKGVEIGHAFANTQLSGTQVHDGIHLEGDQLVRSTNRSGGLEGGITNGQPLVIRTAMKPIATTLTPQETVDLASGEEVPTQYERSDFCPVPRAVPILECVFAFVLADEFLRKVGGDSLEEIQPRFQTLKQMRLSDLPMDNQDHSWWTD
jgi:chorismate synthase